MEQSVLKITKQAINDIKNRVTSLNKFVGYLDNVQPHIKMLKLYRILLIDKKYVDKIYLDSISKDLLSLLKNKNEKTDLEEMLLWHTILAIVKKNSKKNRVTAKSLYEEIEAFYANSRYDISFSNLYEQIIELEQSIAIMKEKIKVIYENCKYDNQEAFVNNPDFDSIVNTKEMHYQNGLILNELGESLIIENYYLTNIDLSPSSLSDSCLSGRLFSIKLTLEQFMPSLLKTIEKHPYPTVKFHRKNNQSAENGTTERLYLFFKIVNPKFIKKENSEELSKIFGINSESYSRTIIKIEQSRESNSDYFYKKENLIKYLPKVRDWIELMEDEKFIETFYSKYPFIKLDS